MVPEPLEAGLTTANMCGVPLNGGFTAQVGHLIGVLPEARRIGTEWTIEQSRGLLAGGAPGIHYYVLNRATQMEQVFTSLRGEGLLG